MNDTGEELIEFLSDYLDKSGQNGYVIGLSGGLDSTTSAYLAVEAVGKENLKGLIMPANPSSSENMSDAEKVAEELGIEYETIDIEPLVKEFSEKLENKPGKTALGNLRARVRMNLLYLEANTRDFLVLGTGNKSEWMVGYFTKYGDGAADVSPLINLYKTEVKELARNLGVSKNIIEKSPTAGLWENQTDEEELGISYSELDKHLKMIENNQAENSKMFKRVQKMVEESRHKRESAYTP